MLKLHALYPLLKSVSNFKTCPNMAVGFLGKGEYQGMMSSSPSTAFIVCGFFDNSHSGWCEVNSHCSLDLHFSNN